MEGSRDKAPQIIRPIEVHTDGGTYVEGGVQTGGGDFVSGDKVIFTEDQTHTVTGLLNPYPGLNSFNYANREAYAGRSRAVQEALERLVRPGAQQVVLFITGASGSGKSSFAQAGLLPALETYYQERSKRARWAVFRPANNPLAMLADALGQLGMPAASAKQLAAFSPKEFGAYLAGAAPPDQVNLLVIDQFEECFTQAEAKDSQRLFDWLAKLPAFDEIHTHILVTLRSDYLKELFDVPALWELAKNGMELRSMSLEELHDAIQRPLQARLHEPAYLSKCFEPALVDRLAADTAEDAAYLPLLQVTLQALWKGGRLTLDRYGRLPDAIRQRAERVVSFADFDASYPNRPRPAEEQAALLEILLGLVRVSPDDDPRRDVRCRRLKMELVGRSALRERILDELVTARLLSVESITQDDRQVDVVDIIHESLLNNWPYLSQAVAARRELLQQRARFETYLREWLASGLSSAYLITGVHLEEARALAEQNDIALANGEAQRFLNLSLERAEAETRRQLALERAARRRTQAIAAIIGGLLLVSLVWILKSPVASLFERSEMRSIPAGPAVLGSASAGENMASATAIPLAGYSIERYEVTNARYRACVQFGPCSEPKDPVPLYDPARAQFPATNVTAIQAYTFCDWIGRRLPSELEWERAARGPRGDLWPWGNQPPDSSRANLSYGDASDSEAVDARPGGCSAEGVCGLIGNAAEWTASELPADEQYHLDNIWPGPKDKNSYNHLLIMRGGDYQVVWGESQPMLAWLRMAYSANDSVETIGFRCAGP